MTPVVSDETPAGVRALDTPPAGSSLALGHRRLAILDLSATGHQPMGDAAGRTWLTYNGEIYNYVELRSELSRLGHSFRSGSDTEVILTAWQQWGVGCLDRFNGMFAFVLFDSGRREVFAARDRFGVKPLYRWATPTGGIAFASEIKQFTSHPEWRARLNGQRAYDYLNWGITNHTAETLFADVRQLRGGEFIHAPLEGLPTAKPARWYTLRPAVFEGDFSSAATRYRELLDDSVRLRLRADVPVGSCLSGGLDSSSIVCAMQRQLGDRAAAIQKTFSAYSDTPRFDERSYVEEAVQASGATPHSIIPKPDQMLSELPALIWHQDEPFGSTSVFAQWCVFRLARENGVLVMLDGQGADEALGGYHTYFGPRMAGLLRRGRVRQLWRESAALRSLHGHSWYRQAKQTLQPLFNPRLVDGLRRLTAHPSAEPEFIDLARLGATPAFPCAIPRDFDFPVRALGHAQLTALNLPMLLHWEDRDSMAYGVEARLPFLDYRLVEYSLGLPEDFKLCDGWTKRVLREGMRGRLPETIRMRRDKLGFATAEEVWMRETARPAFERLASEAIADSEGILTSAALAKVQRTLNGREPFNFVPWRMINFGGWVRRFEVKV